MWCIVCLRWSFCGGVFEGRWFEEKVEGMCKGACLWVYFVSDIQHVLRHATKRMGISKSWSIQGIRMKKNKIGPIFNFSSCFLSLLLRLDALRTCQRKRLQYVPSNHVSVQTVSWNWKQKQLWLPPAFFESIREGNRYQQLMLLPSGAWLANESSSCLDFMTLQATGLKNFNVISCGGPTGGQWYK